MILADIIDDMTLSQAKFIRKLRVQLDYTWRAVARDCFVEFDGEDDNAWALMPSNQLVGIELCRRAAKMFDEDYMKEPWN